MKSKYIIAMQVALLVLTIIAGFLLNNDLSDGPRDLHRVIGGSAQLVGFIGAVVITARQGGKKVIATAWASVVFSFMAASAGRLSGSTSSTLALMRISGVLALVTASFLLWALYKETAPTKS